jgi:hypothetical protein
MQGLNDFLKKLNKKIMKKILLSVAICFLSCFVIAQSKWASVGTTYNWTYVFDGATSNKPMGAVFPIPPNYNPNSSISTSSKGGFLPKPASGTAKVYCHLEGGGTFSLIESGEDDKLRMTASKTSAVDKFSVYGIPEATALTAFYATLNFENNVASSSDWVLGLGYQDPKANATKFNNGSGIPNGGVSTEVFACFRFAISKTDASKMNVRYAGVNASSVKTFVSLGDIVKRGMDNQLEFLCNNTNVEQSYKRGDVSYKVASGFYHVWLNNALLSLSANNYDFKGTELEPGLNINAMVLQGANNKTNEMPSNDGSVIISKLIMQFGK